MMTTQEFRIGNLIKDIGENGEIFTIDGLEKDKVHAGAMTIYKAGLEHEHGITLTEEWLLKLGFEFRDDYRYHHKASGWYLQPYGSRVNDDYFQFSVVIGQEVTCYTPGEELKKENRLFIGVNHITTVHRLQNVWFALREEELTIQS